MNRWSFSILCLLTLFPIAANAGTIQLPMSGQSTVFAAHDDGAVRVGKQWPSPRLCDNGNGTVTDNLTGLIWTRDANLMKGRDPGFDTDGTGGDGSVTWQHALDYIKKLNAEKYLGYNDWRLPNLNELASLVNQGEAGVSTWLNRQGFVGVKPFRYWSSSTNVMGTGTAWTLIMADGTLNYLKKSGLGHVWPVRGGQSGAASPAGIHLPKTGQIDCFDANGATISCAGTGQDGDIQMGAAWPQPRFSDNGDQTVTDNLTGLIWTRDANLMIIRDPSFNSDVTNYDGAVTWQGALDYVQKLNQESYLGFSDWRLPNRNELASLVNYVEADPFAWLNWQGFFSVQNKYWSSGTVASVTGNAWNVYTTGVILDENKSAAFGGSFVWPVRGVATNTVISKAAAAALSVSTSALADGYIATTYSQTLAATGGTPPYTWSRTSGTLPTGLSLSSAGVISGKPTATGSKTFTVQVKDASAATATKSLTIVVYSALSVSTSSLSAATTGTAYSKTLAATGGKTPYSWSLATGSLPTGLGLNSATGAITGTPTVTGTSSFTVQVTDANNKTALKAFSIVTNAGTLTVTSTNLADGYTGTAYGQTLTAKGGSAPFTWSISSGTLQTGLTLNATTGVISGTPTVTGAKTFTVQVKDTAARTATKSLTITVYAPAAITTASLPDGYLGAAYSQTLAATGGKSPYTWSIASGSLPAGLTLSTAGVISGTPTAAGSSSFAIQVKDTNNNTATRPLMITVYTTPIISTASLSAGAVGAVYNQTLGASGGKTPYTWGISSGTLPTGLSLNASTGVISGSPTTSGASSVTFKVTDANAKTATKSFSITINAGPPSITTASLADGYVGVSYSQTLAATGGKSAYTWSRTGGSLPAGLSLSSAGVISGRPTTDGTSSFTVKVKDANNATATATLAINVIPPVTLLTTSLPAGSVGSSYNQALAASGGKTPYTWSITSGSLPAGLSLNSSVGTITGTPTTTANASFTVQVKDANNISSTSDMSLIINPPVSIVTTALHDNFVGISYSHLILAANGVPPYTWALTGGNLPAGLSLDTATGMISGTPTAIGSSTFTIQVKDAGNTVVSKLYTVKINGFGSISGVVTDQSNGLLLQGVSVTLNLTDIKTENTGDLSYECKDGPIAATDYEKISANDGIKVACDGWDGVTAKVHNPFNTSDAFTLRWNGLSAYTGNEYLAQSFKPTKSGKLTRVSFYLSTPVDTYPYGSPCGEVYALLKTKLGGDRGMYLAHSERITPVSSIASGSWVDFDFTSPVDVSAGQDYYVELKGSMGAWSYIDGWGTHYVYKSALWGYGTQYIDGFSYIRSSGIWSRNDNSLAFRTYIDGQSDITTSLPTDALSMHGAAGSAPEIYTGGGQCKIDYVPNNDFYDANNSDDFTCSRSVGNGSYYYDQNGWITATLYSDSDDAPEVALVTDQFNLTFNRTLTATTDINGAYSFSNLPDGNYSIINFKENYADKTTSGHLSPGQGLNITSSIANYIDTTITTVNLPNGFIGYYYDATLQVAGNRTPYNWSINSGGLPNGFALSASDGRIQGNPSTPGKWDFTVQVKGSDGVSITKPLSITIYSNAGNIRETTLSDAMVGTAYNQTLAVNDTTNAPFTWSIASGSLPVGLTLNSSTGAITGTPTVAGNTSSFFVMLKDANNITSIRQFGIYVYFPPNVNISTSKLPDAVVGAAYNQSLAVTGGAAPFTWSIYTGSLPAGLTLDSSTGTITGTPTTIGTNRFSASVRDAYTSTAKSLTLAVTPPPFTVRSLGDTGNVAVMEVTGNFDAKNPDGSINELPRRMIATEYFKTHGDLDFLVMLSTFEYALPEAGAQGFYLGVKNNVQGINQAIFDNSAQFGSAGMLQGTIDLGNVSALAANPYGTSLDQTVTTLNHELMHRFGAYVRYRNTDGTLNTALLGKDSAHWSYLLDTQGSIMYGNGWKENGNGTFTSTAKMSGYSPLDLYLMGMIPKEQVPPMLLIDNPAIDKTQLPHLGDTITGAAKTVTIDDIIAAEGTRVPDSSSSQKKFNIGFVLLTRAGDSATPAVQAIETMRTAFAGRFAQLTHGISGVNGVTPSVSVVIDSPADGATITGPDVTVTGVVINSTGAETGVTVNGIPAAVSGSRFIVNHAPLQTGANTITITATDANGLTSSAARSVTAAAGNYIRISSNIESGVAPLDISLSLDGSFNITNPTVTASGPVAVTLTPGTSQTEFTATLTVEGIYTFTASAVGPDGQTFSDTVTITVESKAQLDTLLKTKWTAMRTALATGDVTRAIANFSEFTKDSYQEEFTGIAESLPQVAAAMSNITMVKVEDNLAEYDLRDLVNGVTCSYYLLFVKDKDGIWRIRNF